MALTKITLTLDQLALDAVMDAIGSQSKYLTALGLQFAAEVKAQIQEDSQREAKQVKQEKKEAKKKANGQDRIEHGTGPPAG